MTFIQCDKPAVWTDLPLLIGMDDLFADFIWNFIYNAAEYKVGNEYHIGQ